MSRYTLLLAPFGALLGCATSDLTPPKTQLQVREFQTRSYDTSDAKMVIKAVFNVLQDDGFIVKVANVDLGLLTATREADIESKGERLGAILKGLYGLGGTWKKAAILDATANVSEFGAQTKVRMNFQLKVLDNKGGVRKLKEIDDPKYYQDFFSKIDKGIFLQKEKVS